MAGGLLGDRYLQNTHCEDSVLLELVVWAVFWLGWLPSKPVSVSPAAHMLQMENTESHTWTVNKPTACEVTLQSQALRTV